MKKILHIQVLPKMSGVQKVSYELLKYLPDNKYDKYILFSDSDTIGDRQEVINLFTSIGVTVLFSQNLKREICIKDINALIEIYNLSLVSHKN